MIESKVGAADSEAADSILPSLGQLDPEERLEAIPHYQEYAEQVSRGIHHVVLNGGAPTRRIADFLHGTWLGHPLHSVLTDFTIGAWMFGSLMDLLSLTGRPRGTRYARRSADQLIALGTLGALPTAVAGLADYSTIPKGAASTGATHGLVNVVALILYGLSWWLRRIGSRSLAMLFSGMGFGIIMVSSWLGGELNFRYRVGVNQVKGHGRLESWQTVTDDQDLQEHQPRRVDVEGQPVLIYRHQGHIYAIGAVCAHAGGALEQGHFAGTQVECPLHQSVYDLCSGRVVHGPATYPEPSFETRVSNGKVEIRSPR